MRRIRLRRSISHKRRDGVEDEGERGGGIYKRRTCNGVSIVARRRTRFIRDEPQRIVLIPDFCDTRVICEFKLCHTKRSPPAPHNTRHRPTRVLAVIRPRHPPADTLHDSLRARSAIVHSQHAQAHAHTHNATKAHACPSRPRQRTRTAPHTQRHPFLYPHPHTKGRHTPHCVCRYSIMANAHLSLTCPC